VLSVPSRFLETTFGLPKGNIFMAPRSWTSASQRDTSCRMGGNALAVIAIVGGADGACTDANPQQAQFHARSSGGRDESASYAGPCGAGVHVRVPWKRAGARLKRHLLQTLNPQPSAVGAYSITSSDRSRDRSHALK
jgi:hypothetical protein